MELQRQALLEDLERDLRDVCEWLGWWEPGQQCQGECRVSCIQLKEIVETSDGDIDLVTENVHDPHEKPLPKLDDALAMRVLRELRKRFYNTSDGHWTRQDWNSMRQVLESIWENPDPAEAIIRRAAALARQETP